MSAPRSRRPSGQRRIATFQFAIGDRVELPTGAGGGHGEIVQQRITYRAVLGEVIEYLVHRDGGETPGNAWYYEPDLVALKEATP